MTRYVYIAIAIAVVAIVVSGAALGLLYGRAKPVTVTESLIKAYTTTYVIQRPATVTTTTTTTSTTTVTTTATLTASPTTHRCTHWITLTILTRHPTEILQLAEKMFLSSPIAKEYCIKEIKPIKLPPGWWAKYIREHHVDVLWGGGPLLYDQLLSMGLLRPLTSPLVLKAISQIPNTIAGVPTKRVVNGKIYWVADAVSSFGFTVNTKVAKELGFDWHKLRDWSDLASDELGLLMLKTGVPVVGIADPTMSTSNAFMYEIILQAYGWDRGWGILTLLAANSRIYLHSYKVRDAVIYGEVMVGITIDFYGYTAHEMNPACIYIVPASTVVDGDPIAVAASTEHPEAAQAFVAWALTAGQEIWLNKKVNRMPVNPSVWNTTLGKERTDLYHDYIKLLHMKSLNLNYTLATETWNAMTLYFKATLVDEHDLLVKAWKALLKAYYIDHKISKAKFEELKKLLMSLPKFKDPLTGKVTTFTPSYAAKVSSVLEKNPKLASEFMAAWRAAARQKYLEVLKELGYS